MPVTCICVGNPSIIIPKHISPSVSWADQCHVLVQKACLSFNKIGEKDNGGLGKELVSVYLKYANILVACFLEFKS